ncbi:MAG TPA: CorA family magnesium transporter [Candidatus Gracilibacteria bacterium]
MKCIIFSKNQSSESIVTDLHSVAKTFDIHVRDLRPVFSVRQLITISARGKGLVVNLGILKMVIGAHKVYLFNADHPEVYEGFIKNLKKSLDTNHGSLTPFEFIVLETALTQRFQKFKADYDIIEKDTEKALRQSENTVSDEIIGTLLNLKKRLSNFETTVSEMNQSLMTALEDEEELEDFYLSKKPENQDVEEIESVLEFFAEPTEDIVHKLEDLKENIDDTQEFMNLKLSSLRNTIIRFDLIATFLTAILAFMAFITGLYGMNVKNNIEESFETFLLIILLLVTFGVITFAWLWHYMKKRNIF